VATDPQSGSDFKEDDPNRFFLCTGCTVYRYTAHGSAACRAGVHGVGEVKGCARELDKKPAWATEFKSGSTI